MFGKNKTYNIEYLTSVVEEDIPDLPKTARNMIKKAIEERLMTDPVGFGKPLRYSLKAHRRLRVGDYRIVYRIDASIRTVFVIAIKHRKDIYEEF
jgi:mRNA-degrading endonuclease RelE of RelBE toxin-antitoxin system